MKAIVSLLLATASITLLASPALAGKQKPKKEVDEVSKLNLGLKYALKPTRASALPAETVDKVDAKSLTENQVGAIVRERSEDLEYCWLRLPPAKRVVSAAILHLSIEATGKVAAVEVNGDLPAGVGKCITQMAGRWAFPVADAASEIDHGIMLTTSSQKTR